MQMNQIHTPFDVLGRIGGGKSLDVLPSPVAKAPGYTDGEPFCFHPSPSCSWSVILGNIESSAIPKIFIEDNVKIFVLGMELFEGNGAIEIGLACVANFQKKKDFIDSKIQQVIDAYKMKL